MNATVIVEQTGDNARKGTRTLSQAALAGFIVEILEKKNVYQFDGYEELMAISILVGIISFIQNEIEARTGRKLLAPKVEIAGADALGQKEIKPVVA